MNQFTMPCPDTRWLTFGNTAVLWGWAQELKSIHQESPDPFWKMIGRAAMLIHPFESARRELPKLIAAEAGLDIFELDNQKFVDLVTSGAKPSISRPTLIVVPQGDWSRNAAAEEIAERVTEFHRMLAPYLNSLDNESPCIFLTTGNSYADLHPNLRVAGGFDRRFIIPKPSYEQIGSNFLDLVGVTRCANTLLLDTLKVGKLIDEEFDDERRQGLIALALQRLSYKEDRVLEFSDLVYFAVHGSAEVDAISQVDEQMRKRVAVHEAGHAVMCMVDSAGLNIPDYLSIIPTLEFNGIAVDSYAFVGTLNGKYTYEDSRHKIRTVLAGRAAESIIFGSTRIGTFGSRADLINASNWTKELVGKCGIEPSIDNPHSKSCNLLVTSDEPTSSESAHIEIAARKYLRIQYEQTIRILSDHKDLLVSVSDELLNRSVLFQDDLLRLYCKADDPERCLS